MIIVKKERWMSFAVMMILLTCFCVVPQLHNLFEYSRRMVDTASVTNSYNISTLDYTEVRQVPKTDKPVSIKAQLVEQQLFLTGRGDKVEIYLQAPSGQLYGQGKVIFTLRQGAKVVSAEVEAVELPTNGYYTLPVNLKSFESGNITLTMESMGIPEGTDVFCFVSDWLASELEDASVNGSNLGGVLYLRYDMLIYNSYFLYDVIILSLLMAVIFLTAWVLAFRGEKLATGYGLFICSALLIFLTKSLENPFVSFFGEPRSEAVYDLWYNVQTKSFFGNLMSLLSGESLIWPERLLMSLTKLIAPEELFFRVAQLFELMMVSLLVSIPCLKSFDHFFTPIVRLCVSLLFGCGLVFEKMYLLWSVSYWATFLFIFMAIMDMKKFKRWHYALCMLITLICCFSRIYFVVLIPIMLLFLILVGKKRGNRFIFWCLLVIAGCVAQAAYSFAIGAGHHISGAKAGFDVLSILVNTVYYQAQVIISLLTGSSHVYGALLNIMGLTVIAAAVTMFIVSLSGKSKNIPLACALGGFGMLSLGTIMINVFTCATTTSVHFPHNYADAVNWYTTYYQDGDLHFSFAYVSVLCLLLTMVYACVEALIKKTDSRDTDRQCANLQKAVSISVCLMLLCIFSLRSHERMNIDEITVDWCNTVQVTKNESFFIPTNVHYLIAQISMEQGTDSIIFGRDASGAFYSWSLGSAEYDHNTVYTDAILGECSDLEIRQVVSVTVNRPTNSFDTPMIMVLTDRAGNEISRVLQSTSVDRVWVDFFLGEPVDGVYAVAFELGSGTDVYIRDAIQIGVLEEAATQ